MIAITVRPPWSWVLAEAAALAALGVVPKLVDNRGRRVAEEHLGQPVAIHAGLRWDAAAADDPWVRAAWQAFSAAIHHRDPEDADPRLVAIGDRRTGCTGHSPRPWPDDGWVRRGAVVALARLVDCHRARPQPQPACCAPLG